MQPNGRGDDERSEKEDGVGLIKWVHKEFMSLIKRYRGGGWIGEFFP